MAELAAQEVVDAVREILPTLRTSHDRFDSVPAVMKSHAQVLREQAERIEREDAAIWRLRKAVAALDAEDGSPA